MFALVHITCVCWYVFKDEHTLTHPLTHRQLHTFHHGQTTCLSHGSFLKAVRPAGSDSIWKTCLNESTHQLHQHILTSRASPSRLTLLSICLCLSHISLFITSLPFPSVYSLIIPGSASVALLSQCFSFAFLSK